MAAAILPRSKTAEVPAALSVPLRLVRMHVRLPLKRCRAVSRSSEVQEIFQSGIPVGQWPLSYPNVDFVDPKVEVDELKNRIKEIKSMLSSMGDGEITVSPYDTAWVALIKDANDNACPQFPSSLRWIVDHQLPDGSWGDHDIFVAYDRIINTLACIVALKSWNICPKSCERGISFLRKNIVRLEEEDREHMPIGFEVAFPSLVEIALTMDLGLPFDSPAVKDIYAQRILKLNKIPKEVMHSVPTTLLHSLEGMPGLDWERLLSLQCLEGSFLFSPSSTAFAFAQTRDQNCLRYLERMIDKFDGGGRFLFFFSLSFPFVALVSLLWVTQTVDCFLQYQMCILWTCLSIFGLSIAWTASESHPTSNRRSRFALTTFIDTGLKKEYVGRGIQMYKISTTHPWHFDYYVYMDMMSLLKLFNILRKMESSFASPGNQTRR
ncbi:hypothetical protein QJS04_geneDACA010226 [Acorus gramineus]|uniref:Terpene synthase N-terminal domain-containing protein n=1 Tax=Acorus gramineus TaxID=55184 RepID=A0AAV9A450_ACOGR|nr:hypothetical protein QJS04_geneDACA010226 [Acorus gramineus]